MDHQSVAPVAYPTRVAPLPEYRPVEERREPRENNVELERERQRIEADQMARTRLYRVVEEEKLPFPTLIKAEQGKKKEKVVYDLKEAIQLLKVWFVRLSPSVLMCLYCRIHVLCSF